MLRGKARVSHSELRAWVVENHPYDLPEIISLPLSDGLSDYIEWVKKETERG